MAYKRARKTHARKGVTVKRVTVARDAKGRFTKRGGANDVKHTRHKEYRTPLGEFAESTAPKEETFKAPFDAATIPTRELLYDAVIAKWRELKRKLVNTDKELARSHSMAVGFRVGGQKKAFRSLDNLKAFLTSEEEHYISEVWTDDTIEDFNEGETEIFIGTLDKQGDFKGPKLATFQ